MQNQNGSVQQRDFRKLPVAKSRQNPYVDIFIIF